MYLPMYYKKIGYVISSIIVILVTILIRLGLKRLVECNAKNRVEYPDMTEWLLVRVLKMIINLLMFFGQLLYNIAHLTYIAHNVSFMILRSTNLEKELVVNIVGAILALIVFPLMCVKKWKGFPELFVITSVIIFATLFCFSASILSLTLANTLHLTKSNQRIYHNSLVSISSPFKAINSNGNNSLTMYREASSHSGYKLILYFAI